MQTESIFVPVTVLAIWTLVVVFLTGLRRVRAARAGRVPPGAFRVGESAAVPDDVAVVNRHLMNLLEMPLLFYVVVLGFYVTRRVEAITVGLSWAYVALRLMHSFIHLTSNRIIPRLMTFAASNIALLAMWLWFLWRLI